MIRFKNDDDAAEPPKPKAAVPSRVPIAETPPETRAADKSAKAPQRGRRERAKAPVEDQSTK
jgi:hypothetical protein